MLTRTTRSVERYLLSTDSGWTTRRHAGSLTHAFDRSIKPCAIQMSCNANLLF
jgi:hypothetical protein